MHAYELASFSDLCSISSHFPAICCPILLSAKFTVQQNVRCAQRTMQVFLLFGNSHNIVVSVCNAVSVLLQRVLLVSTLLHSLHGRTQKPFLNVKMVQLT